jgi:hypothetical protein
MSSSDSSSGIDKETLYKEFTSRRRWQDKLFKSGCHKALDIPEDDMNLIQQSHGIGGKHLLSTPAPPTSAPAPQEYDVTFWVDGEEITVTEPKE